MKKMYISPELEKLRIEFIKDALSYSAPGNHEVEFDWEDDDPGEMSETVDPLEGF